MKRQGSELIFISQIKRDGSGTIPIENDYLEILQKEDLYLTHLSLSEKTYIASGFNSFVVKLKPKEIKQSPEIVCMCGSSRFSDLMAAISWEYEKLGKIVLRVNYLPSWYIGKSDYKESHHLAEQCEKRENGIVKKIQELHLSKIDISDKVFICNFDNYIGEGTKQEIEYAKKIGKPVYYLEMGTEDPEISAVTSKLCRWWVDA